MQTFPRTAVGGVSVSRMIIGTNWLMAGTHCTRAKDLLVHNHFKNPRAMADVIEAFLNNGVDTIMGLASAQPLADGIKEAQDRTGKKVVMVTTPIFPVTKDALVHGLDTDGIQRTLDSELEHGADICMPHCVNTDSMIDCLSREIRLMPELLKMIRERGFATGLSTHMPEAILFADETNLDVDTYISIYNAMGFLMHLEVDWTARMIRDAKKPVMTIKPMAAGHIRPFQALTFAWNTIRPQDMMTVGVMTPDEAKELVDMSLEILEGQSADTELQATRSKNSLKAADLS